MSKFVERRIYWLLVAIAALTVGLGWGRLESTPARAELLSAPSGSGGLISHFRESVAGNGAGNGTRVILIDPQLRRMAVYDVPTDSGAIQLRSVRNLSADLQVQAYNSEDPSPIDMQKMLERN